MKIKKKIMSPLLQNFEFSIKKGIPTNIQEQLIRNCYSHQKKYRSHRASQNLSIPINLDCFQSNKIAQECTDIIQKKEKRAQILRIKKQQEGCYMKLAKKLKNQLKQMKTHDSSQAKQKLKLLDTCLNHKHSRMKFEGKIERSKYSTPRTPSISRWSSACQRIKKKTASSIKIQCDYRIPYKTQDKQNHEFSCQMNPSLNQYSKIRQNNFVEPVSHSKSKNIELQSFPIQQKLDQIKYVCQRQELNSNNIKRDLSIVNFYSDMVFFNSDQIVKQMI